MSLFVNSRKQESGLLLTLIELNHGNNLQMLGICIYGNRADVRTGQNYYRIELAALCVAGVYGSVFIEADGILHIIFNPEKTNPDEIGKAIELAVSMAHCNPSEENIQSDKM
ncbi:MAG: hypothetical protein LBV71_03530 [Prevotella sp.]|jgi:hypothetical protein|nr:hypothetical protein [Prevotella sp.]